MRYVYWRVLAIITLCAIVFSFLGRMETAETRRILDCYEFGGVWTESEDKDPFCAFSPPPIGRACPQL